MRVILDVTNIWDEARQLVEANLVDVVSAHRVEEVRLLVDDVLVVEEELVRLEQLLLLYRQNVLFDVVAHDMEVLHIVVADGLSAKHDQVVSVDHMQANEPDAAVRHRMQDDPRVPLDVELLDAGAVAARLISDGIDVPVAECARVRAADGLV